MSTNRKTNYCAWKLFIGKTAKVPLSLSYVEALDRYFGSVCELDIVFNFPQASYLLDEMIMGGEMGETSLRAAVRAAIQLDEQEQAEAEAQRIF